MDARHLVFFLWFMHIHTVGTQLAGSLPLADTPLAAIHPSSAFCLWLWAGGGFQSSIQTQSSSLSGFCSGAGFLLGLKARSWGASTRMKMCIQADLDTTGALRHMNKNNSERPVCSTHPLAPISTSFLFVFDTEWVMSTCEHQGRDTVLQTGVKIDWSRRSASSCFN